MFIFLVFYLNYKAIRRWLEMPDINKFFQAAEKSTVRPITGDVVELADKKSEADQAWAHFEDMWETHVLSNSHQREVLQATSYVLEHLRNNIHVVDLVQSKSSNGSEALAQAEDVCRRRRHVNTQWLQIR